MRIDELRHQLAETDAEWSVLDAQFGPAGVGGLSLFDVQRKELLSACALDFRTAQQQAGVKTTEGAVDEAAHSDPRYVSAIRLAVGTRERYARLAAKRAALKGELRIEEAREIAMPGYRVAT